jgi:hypothetical protein
VVARTTATQKKIKVVQREAEEGKGEENGTNSYKKRGEEF